MLLAGIAFRPPYQRGASQTHSRTTDLPAVAGDHARRPLLILTFTVEPGSTACCFCDGIGAGSALSPDRFFWRRAALPVAAAVGCSPVLAWAEHCCRGLQVRCQRDSARYALDLSCLHPRQCSS